MDITKDNEFCAVHQMYDDYVQDISALEKLQNIELTSFTSSYKDIYRKVFVIACANSFERHFCRKLPDLILPNELLSYFVKNQALERKYHSLFDWKGKNANKFYGLFGNDFKKQMEAFLKDNATIKQSEESFIAIGRYRNLVVHEGFDTNPFNEDIKSIKDKFDEALLFYNALWSKISESTSFVHTTQHTHQNH